MEIAARAVPNGGVIPGILNPYRVSNGGVLNTSNFPMHLWNARRIPTRDEIRRYFADLDFQDVMDGVDKLLQLGYIDKNNLFVTGGSAGGIMTAWIIGKTNRFKAAAVIKPVMNWISKTLVADNYFNYANYRYKGQPWENFDEYWKFSPISLVGNIETPTMVMVGTYDLRTPPSEAKQLYHALKIRKIETVYVEVPEAYHGISSKPSQLITKIETAIELKLTDEQKILKILSSSYSLDMVVRGVIKCKAQAEHSVHRWIMLLAKKAGHSFCAKLRSLNLITRRPQCRKCRLQMMSLKL